MSNITFDFDKSKVKKVTLNVNNSSFYLYIIQDEEYLKDSSFFNLNVLIESEDSKLSLVYQEVDNYAKILSYTELKNSLQFKAIMRYEEVIYIKIISPRQKLFMTLYTESLGKFNLLFCDVDEDFDLIEQELKLMSDFSNLDSLDDIRI